MSKSGKVLAVVAIVVLFMRNYDRWFSVSFYDLKSESNADWFESVRSELVVK